MRDRNMCQREQFAPTMPSRKPGKGIGAEQQNQRRLVVSTGAQAFEGFNGVACPLRHNFGSVDHKSGVIRRCPHNHFQTLFCRDFRGFPVRRATGRYPADLPEAEMRHRFFGEAQMGKVKRIEGAAKNPGQLRQLRKRRKCRDN